MSTAPLTVQDLHPELRSRVLAASGGTEHRAIERLQRDDEPDEYWVVSMSGEQLVLMQLFLRPDGSVHERTETFLVGDTTVRQEDGATSIHVESRGTIRTLPVPPSLGATLADWLRPE